jgi:hypothetical protein
VHDRALGGPPLGLLVAAAQGRVTPDMREVLAMTERLQNDLPHMLAEHRQVVDALEKRAAAVRVEKRPDATRFAEKLRLHAETEEQGCTRRRSSWANRSARGSGREGAPSTHDPAVVADGAGGPGHRLNRLPWWNSTRAVTASARPSPPFWWRAQAPELALVHRWLDNWSGDGLIVTGMSRQGYTVSLGEHGVGRWIVASFHGRGGHSPSRRRARRRRGRRGARSRGRLGRPSGSAADLWLTAPRRS